MLTQDTPKILTQVTAPLSHKAFSPASFNYTSSAFIHGGGRILMEIGGLGLNVERSKSVATVSRIYVLSGSLKNVVTLCGCLVFDNLGFGSCMEL